MFNSSESDSDSVFDSDDSDDSYTEDNWSLLIEDIDNKRYYLPQLRDLFLPLSNLNQEAIDQLTKLINKCLDYCELNAKPSLFLILFLSDNKLQLKITTISPEGLANFLYHIIKAEIFAKDNGLTKFKKLFDLVVHLFTMDAGKKVLSKVIEKMQTDIHFKEKLSILYAVIFDPKNTVFAEAVLKIDAEEIKSIRQKTHIDLEESYSVRQVMKRYPRLSIEDAFNLQRNKHSFFSHLDLHQSNLIPRKHRPSNSL